MLEPLTTKTNHVVHPNPSALHNRMPPRTSVILSAERKGVSQGVSQRVSQHKRLTPRLLPQAMSPRRPSVFQLSEVADTPMEAWRRRIASEEFGTWPSGRTREGLDYHRRNENLKIVDLKTGNKRKSWDVAFAQYLTSIDSKCLLWSLMDRKATSNLDGPGSVMPG
jgi:hypothetical protein